MTTDPGRETPLDRTEKVLRLAAIAADGNYLPRGKVSPGCAQVRADFLRTAADQFRDLRRAAELALEALDEIPRAARGEKQATANGALLEVLAP